MYMLFVFIFIAQQLANTTMDKTLRFFLSGQTTKDSSSTTQHMMGNKGLDVYNHESRSMATSGLRDNVSINNKPYNIQSPKGKDADKYFYIM